MEIHRSIPRCGWSYAPCRIALVSLLCKVPSRVLLRYVIAHLWWYVIPSLSMRFRSRDDGCHVSLQQLFCFADGLGVRCAMLQQIDQSLLEQILAGAGSTDLLVEGCGTIIR